MGAEFHRLQMENKLLELPVLDTCTEVTAQLCCIPGGRGGKFKLPTLTELHEFLFNEPFAEAHNATADVEATTRCFLELIRKRVFTAEELDVKPDYFENFSEANPQPIELIGLKHINLKESFRRNKEKTSEERVIQGFLPKKLRRTLKSLMKLLFRTFITTASFPFCSPPSALKILLMPPVNKICRLLHLQIMPI